MIYTVPYKTIQVENMMTGELEGARMPAINSYTYFNVLSSTDDECTVETDGVPDSL